MIILGQIEIMIILITIFFISAALLGFVSGGNINLLTINLDQHLEDKSVTTGNSARIELNSDEMRAVE